MTINAHDTALFLLKPLKLTGLSQGHLPLNSLCVHLSVRELVRASRGFLFGSVCLASVRSIKRAQLQLYRVGLAVLTLYCGRIFKTITNRDWNWRKIIQFSVQSDSLQCEIKAVCFSVNLKPYRWVLSAFFTTTNKFSCCLQKCG